MSATIESLPTHLLAAILEYVSLTSERRFLGTTQRFWQHRRDIVSNRRRLVAEDRIDIILLEWAADHFTSLVELDLGENGSDDFLQSTARCFPSLQRLSLVASRGVTDRSLRTLTMNASYKPRLTYLDITYCHNTSYRATLPLRRAFDNGIVIRRQPEWMDGHFETPFPNDGIHTYWADGSFKFARDSIRGHILRVCRFDPSNNNHACTQLQLANFQPPSTWAEWTRVVYRPGVSILHIEDKSDGGDRTLLVAQAQRGTKAPKHWPKPHHNELPIGVSTYYTRDGDVLEEPALSDVMVTRMRVLPLDSLMPPEDVVQVNEEFLQREMPPEISDRRRELAFERILHAALGGPLQLEGLGSEELREEDDDIFSEV